MRTILAALAVLLGLAGIPGAFSPALAQNPPSATIEPFVTDGEMRILELSPDGSMVAATNTGARILCTYAVPSGEKIACADLDAQKIAFRFEDMAWAPDSSAIVFAEQVFRYFGDGDLWQFDAHSGELSNLTDDGYTGALPLHSDDPTGEPVYADVAPSWSPDGATIAFSRTTYGVGDETPSTIWTLDVASGKATELSLVDPAYPGAVYFNTGWSPDGKTIYASVTYADPDEPRSGIWAYDAIAGDGEQLIGPVDEFDGEHATPALVAVSPTGDALLLCFPAIMYEAGITPEFSGYALYSLTTNELTMLEPAAEMTGQYAVTVTPAFAHDGTTVVFGVRRPSEQEGLIVARDIERGADTILATLPDAEMPYVVDPNMAMTVSTEGLAFIHTGLTEGYLVTLPAAEPPEAETTAPIPALHGDD
jgi:dipeptidyl aminopeptidase/acylaminoacyl peptidase